jgi:hypothetical protein
MKTKIKIESIWGKLLFEFEKENNSIKESLQEAKRRGADLQGADLQGAYLRGADLQGAYLRGAYLQGAYLQGAYLRGADLQRAYLQGAYLQGADLRGAYLQGAYLLGAYLRGADLQRADLQGAYLRGAYLQGADLRGADLQRADLRGANSLNTLLPAGELIVWKKLQNNLIAKLLIPIKAKRVNCIGSRKCRFEYCKVIAIYDGKKRVNEGRGQYNKELIYKVGEIVIPDKFDPSPLIECSNGIHAFITRLEAEEY